MYDKEQQEPPVVAFPDSLIQPPTEMVKARHVPMRKPIVLAPGNLPYLQSRTQLIRVENVVIFVVIVQRYRPLRDNAWSNVARVVPTSHAQQKHHVACVLVVRADVAAPLYFGITISEHD